MAPKVFINLPVADLERSKRFYAAVGFTLNPQFTDETAAGVAISDAINVMLLTHAKFAEFSPLPVADAAAKTAVLNCLQVDSREAVDTMIEKAKAAGGMTGWRAPQDHGFMYGQGFQDPDGHVWEVMWMDAAAMTGSDPAAA